MKILYITLLLMTPLAYSMNIIESLKKNAALSFSVDSFNLLAETKNANPSLEKIQELLNNGADPNAHDVSKSTPPYSLMTAMHYAAKNNNADLCLLLRKYGADTNITNEQELTPLMLAAQRGHTEACRALLQIGAFHRNTGSLQTLENETFSFSTTSNALPLVPPNDTQTASLLISQEILDRSNEECQAAQKRLITALLCLTKIRPKLSKDLFLPIICFCKDRKEDICTLLGAGVIQLKELPVNVQPLLSSWEPYHTTSIIESNTHTLLPHI